MSKVGEHEHPVPSECPGGSFPGLANVSPNELTFVRHIASTVMARVRLYEWNKPTGETTPVVMKCLYRGSIPKRYEKSIRRDMAALHQIRHENIVSIFGRVNLQDNFAFIMEYCKYGSYNSAFPELWNTIQRSKRLEATLAPLKIQFVCEVVAAMNYLHGRIPKILHLDLKGDNVLLTENLQLKVCDFGLSRMKTLTLLRSRITSEPFLGGTPGYIAPERLIDCKSPPTDKDDVFAFGILTWEILTDCQPYEDQDMINFILLNQHIALNNKRPDVTKIPDVFPSPIVDLVKQSWTRNPDERPSFEKLWTEISEIKGRIPSYEEKVEDGKRNALSLLDLVFGARQRNRCVSLELPPSSRPVDDRAKRNSLPLLHEMTIPKWHRNSDLSDNVPIGWDNEISERVPLIPTADIQQPYMSMTKSLALVSVLLSLIAAFSVLIWWSTKLNGCAKLGSPTHGHVNCSLSSSKYPPKCRFDCDEGYMLVGRNELTCQDGKWNDKPPTCGRVCPQYPKDPFGNTTCTHGLFVNSTCTAECLQHHVLNGTRNFTCKSNGHWSSNFPNCVCPTCQIGDTCQYSTRWDDIANQLGDIAVWNTVVVEYAGKKISCTPGTFGLFHYHCRCTDVRGRRSVNCEDYDSASGAAVHSASQLIREMVETKDYPPPCDPGKMYRGC